MTHEGDGSPFFVAGGTLRPDSPSYVDRLADEELFNLALHGGYCYVLTARQMGKSSLMIRTARRLMARQISSVIIDLTTMGTDINIDQWYLGIITQLKRRLKLSIDPAGWWNERSGLGHVQRFTDFLRDVVLAEISGQVVIFIDEIDTTLNLPFSDDFFAAIRFAYNARAGDQAFERLSFVLLGVATPPDLIKDRSRTPFNIGQGIDLTDFSRTDSEILRRGLTHVYLERGDAIFNRIYHWTHGHPYLTQKLCLAVTESRNSDWSDQAIDQLVERLFLSKEARKETNLQFVRDGVRADSHRGPLLKLYRRVYQGQIVIDDERSLIQNQLKLFGLVRVENNALKIRNEIYRRVFNAEWIKDNLPADRTRNITVVLALIVVLLIGLFSFSAYQQRQRSMAEQAETLITTFRSTDNEVDRLASLAGLFQLSGYQAEARSLFFKELSPDERLALLQLDQPNLNGKALVTVVKGLYVDLKNNELDNDLLAAMVRPLERVDDIRAGILTTEITQWLQGRTFYNSSDYEQAITVYSLVLGVNDTNPGIYFDRALAYIALDQATEALKDFEEAAAIDEQFGQLAKQEIMSHASLYDSLQTDLPGHQRLAAIIASPTPTNTATPTATATNTPSPSPTATSTHTPVPTNTATPISPASTTVIVAAPTTLPSPTPSPTPIPTPRPAQLVYVQSDRNRHQLGLVSSAGVVNNVNLHLAAGAPAWSPDGAQIAFFGESGISELGELYRSGNGIWLVNPVNYSVRSLLSMDHVKNINWSPDGRKLAFEFGPPNEAHQVLIIDPVDGRELGRFSGEQPAWNPDSNLLVIKSCAPECGLWQIGLDGSGGRLLTDGSTDSYPTWSPDGRYLAFTSRNRTGDWEIYRMTIPGGTLQQLTNRSGTDVSPIFSPDSLEIYFRSDAFGTWQLRAMSINGQNERLILSDIGVSDDWGLARPAIH